MRAQRRRVALIVVLLAALIFSVLWYATSYNRSGSPVATPQPTASTPKCIQAKDAKFVLNVYNTTKTDGLAARNAATLKKRGFTIGKVSNDPKKKKVTGTAEVRYGPAGKANGAAVAKLVTGAKAVPDNRKDTSVDLVLGSAFKGLTKAAAPKPTLPICPSATSPAPTTASAGN